MAEPATRVALLARPGAACDNLQAALRQAGAEVVAVQDPGDGDPAAIAAARPGAVLVALEPAIEGALERYDDVLSQPDRLVIYDEVAVAARREGWEAARWARHLAAKLGGHADVLPPGAGNDDDAPPRARDAAPARAPEPVRAPAPTPRVAEPARATEPEPEPATEPAPLQPPAGGFDAFDADSVHLGLEPAHEDALAKAGEGIDFGGFTPEIMAAMAMEPMPVAMAPAVGDEAPAVDASDAEADEAAPPGSVAGAGPVTPAPAPPADENVLEWDASVASALERTPEPPPAPAAAAPAAPVSFSADEMTLVEMDATPGLAPSAPPVPAAAPASDGGAVVVLAGIGGPDAVRQFLSALPGGFSRPIIVRQRLDGGRHDRLVRQMQRATALPVELAEAGRPLVPGHVYILPDGMATSGGDDATFVPAGDAVPVLAGLPAARSAVLVLSGSDPASVPEVLEAAREGAFVAGQSPEDSFDGAAAAALVAAGGESCTAAELAQRLSSRWLS